MVGRARTLVAGALLALLGAACSGVDPAITNAQPLACPDPSCPTFDDVRPVGPGGQLTIESFDLGFDPVELTANEGDIEITLVNVGAAIHNVTFEALGETPVAEALGGQEATGVAPLFAGDYVFYCSIPGHRPAGMEGTLTVLAGDEVVPPTAGGSEPSPGGGQTATPDPDVTEDVIEEGGDADQETEQPSPSGTSS